MIKIKWFITISIVFVAITTGILYWHYQVMTKSFEHLDRVAYNTLEQKTSYLYQESKNILYHIQDESYRYHEEKQILEEVKIAKSILLLQGDMITKLNKVIVRLVKYQESVKGYEAFSLWQNHQLFFEEKAAEKLYKDYCEYLTEVESVTNPLLSDDDQLDFYRPTLEEFSNDFRHIPLPISKGLLVELCYQATQNAFLAVERYQNRVLRCSNVRYYPCEK